jgi:lysophospholipase L1-like esterase
VETSRAPSPLRNLALALVSTLLFGGLIEAAARLLEPPPVQKEEYLWDWSERFKDAEFYTLEKGEGYPPDEETNVDGFRDFTRPVESRPGLRRIAILGDSVAFGHGLEAAQAFPQILERSLRASGRDVDVFNVALPGWSTRQERIAYERIVRRYKPEAVVLAVCLNDLAELQINLTKPPGFLLSLFKHSAAVRMAMGASNREIGAVEELFNASESPRVDNAFRLFFEEVKALRADAARDGAALSVVVFPFRFQVEPKPPAPSVQERITKFAAVENIPVFDFLPEIAASPSPKDLFLDYDHFNAAGHERVAAWLSTLPPIVGETTAPRTSPPEAEQEFALRRLRAEASTKGAPPARVQDAVIAQAVDDPSPRVRFEAAQTAFHLGLPGASSASALIRGVQHEDPRVRAFATWTLGEMGEVARPAMPALVALARLDGGAGRTGAVTAIGKIGGDSPETIPLLLQELKHRKEAHRYRAARTLGKMGPAAAPAARGLVEALSDPSPLVRLHVVRAFGSMGDGAKPAIPALITLLNHDPDPEVRKEVSLTLSKLPGR